MSGFKIWFEDQSRRDEELKQIWHDVFDAMKIGGLAKADVVSYSLDKATEGLGRKAPAGTLVLNELKPIFDRLNRLDAAYFRPKIEDLTQWLGQSRAGNDATAPQRTVATLLEKLFGKELFHKFYSSDPQASDEPEAEAPKAPAQAPEDQAGGMNQPPMPPEQPMPEPPPPEVPGQQPQVQPQMPMPPPPNNPMPPRPSGFGMGLF